MAADAGRGYSKVLAFWFEALEGTATYEENGQKYLKYNGGRSIQGCRRIMANGFGKPVQPLTGAFQEQRHQTTIAAS
jgi:hypothetical protein